MKKFILVVAAVFTITALVGCGKKKQAEENAMDMSNGVVSDNVISVVDAGSSSVPVMIDNAEALPQVTGEMAAGVEALSDKPSPKQIQQALKNAGFYQGKVDGSIGPKTKKAIEEFQAHNGLKADGKVGPRTWKALSAHLNATTEVVNPTAASSSTGD